MLSATCQVLWLRKLFYLERRGRGHSSKSLTLGGTSQRVAMPGSRGDIAGVTPSPTWVVSISGLLRVGERQPPWCTCQSSDLHKPVSIRPLIDKQESLFSSGGREAGVSAPPSALGLGPHCSTPCLGRVTEAQAAFLTPEGWARSSASSQADEGTAFPHKSFRLPLPSGPQPLPRPLTPH